MNTQSILNLSVIALLLFNLSACTAEKPEQKAPLRGVRSLVVQSDQVVSERSFSGVSVAATETKLSFRVGGQLESLNVKVGQQVKKGELIATLDDRDLQLNFEESKAAVVNARVQADTAKSNLLRIRNLYENDNVALSEYEQAKNSFASAKADLETREKQLDLQQSQLGYTQIKSPMNGIVTQVPVTRNENVNAGEVVAVLSSNKNIEIEVGIPESYVGAVATGMSVDLIFSSLPNKKYSGVVTEISFTAAEYSTYPVTVKLDKPDAALRPGMPAEASFAFSHSDVKAIRVPASAVGEDQQGNFVFVVKATAEEGVGTIERRAVVVSTLTDKGFIILDGLADGDAVVTAGVSKISPGMNVRFTQARK